MGPAIPNAPTNSPSASNTGAAIAYASDTRSPLLTANPCCRIFFSSALTYYYVFLLTQGSVYAFIIPIIFTTVVLNILILYIKKNKFFPEFTKKVLIINNLLLSISVILIPTFIALDWYMAGLMVDVILIVLSTVILIFGLIKLL